MKLTHIHRLERSCRMLKNTNKSVLTLLLLSSFVACNNQNAAVPQPQTATVPAPPKPAPEFVKAAEPIVAANVQKIEDAGVPLDLEMPKPAKKRSPIQGVDCKNFFDKDSLDEAVSKDEMFVAAREYFLFSSGITHGTTVRIGYMPKQKKIGLFTTIVGDTKTCLSKNSMIAVTLKDGDGGLVVHSFDGVHTKNCGTAKKIQDKNKAVGIFPVPINSNFLQNVLLHEPIKIVYEVNNGNVMGFNHLEDINIAELRNGFRCAYEALGYTERVTEDLIDTRINKED